jgi:hypothetical protein
MERSREVADALVRFYEAFGVAEAFDSVVSPDPDAMAIGTDRRLAIATPGKRRSGAWRV